jgi:hypothetical protein
MKIGQAQLNGKGYYYAFLAARPCRAGGAMMSLLLAAAIPAA